MTDLCEVLEWDSEHFGMPIGRVRGRHLDAVTGPAAIAWADRHEIRCLYLLTDAGDAATVRSAEALGFRLVDIRVTLERPARGAGDLPPAVRPATAGDLGVLEPVAERSHVDSRFFSDEGFDRGAAARLYRRWLRDSVVGDLADLAYVADADGRPSGYVTGRTDRQRSTASIGLLAVAEHARGRGLGPQLVDAALAGAARAGAERVSVVTQGRNVAAQRLYQAAGFRTGRLELWYHRWRPAGAP